MRPEVRGTRCAVRLAQLIKCSKCVRYPGGGGGRVERRLPLCHREPVPQEEVSREGRDQKGTTEATRIL